MWLARFFVLLAVLKVCVCVDMRAELDMMGYKGYVDFNRSNNALRVSATFTISPSGQNTTQYDKVELYSVPPVFGRQKSATVVCQTEIGTNITEFTITSPSNLPESVYYHRAAVLSSSTNPSLPKLCGAILPISESVTTFRVKFLGPAFGSVWLRKLDNVGTFVFSELSTASSSPSMALTLTSFSSATINDAGAFNDRCNGVTGARYTIATLYVPNTTVGQGAVGTLSTTSWSGSTMALMSGGNVFACGHLRTVSSKSVSSIINWAEVKGKFTFTQASPFDATTTTVQVDGLAGRTSGYHVNKFPVPQRLSVNANQCEGKFVGGRFNPYEDDVNASPTAGTGSSDEYEIGDLSGKYGSFAGKNSSSGTYKDWNLPLFGPNSIVGRSIVMYKSDGSRLLCSSIGFSGVVTTGVAVFKSPVYGKMYFRQDSSNPDDDTMIFLELASTKKSASSNHNWYIHKYPTNDDAYASTGVCASAGGHYNPSGVSLEDSYSADCNNESPFRCELGDLSQRLAGINIAVTQPTESGKFFFTDEYLHLSGPYSVLGRSIVIQGENAAGHRFACANITQLHPVVVKTIGPWVGTPDGSASASIIIEQATEFDITTANGTFENLDQIASGYHIHEYAIPLSAASGTECSGASVADHYNPFGWVASQSPPATMGTYDQYEAGDFSRKYGFLDNKNTASMPADIMDTNLPLHTRLSSADRCIVIHKKDKNARWKCANFMAVPAPLSNGYAVSAKVSFTTKVNGVIRIRQIVHEDGGAGLTSFDIDVKPLTGEPTSLQHNWRIHVQPVTDETDCEIAEGHFDPYVAIDNKDYSTDCNAENPLFCEVGDLSAKQERYDIGGKRKQFHDVDSPLHTNFTVLGRSIVFQTADGTAARYTCANIVPDDYTYTLSFPKVTTFNRYDFSDTVSKMLGIARLRVIIVHNIDVPVHKDGCSKVMVTIAGGASVPPAKMDQLSQGTGLGQYSSTDSCKTETGPTVMGQKSSSGVLKNGPTMWMVLIGFLVTALTTKLL